MADYVYSVTVPDQYVNELINVFGASWPATILDGEGNEIPNPQTKAQFALDQFDKFVKAKVREKVVDYRKIVAALAVSTTFTFG